MQKQFWFLFALCLSGVAVAQPSFVIITSSNTVVSGLFVFNSDETLNWWIPLDHREYSSSNSPPPKAVAASYSAYDGLFYVNMNDYTGSYLAAINLATKNATYIRGTVSSNFMNVRLKDNTVQAVISSNTGLYAYNANGTSYQLSSNTALTSIGVVASTLYVTYAKTLNRLNETSGELVPIFSDQEVFYMRADPSETTLLYTVVNNPFISAFNFTGSDQAVFSTSVGERFTITPDGFIYGVDRPLTYASKATIDGELFVPRFNPGSTIATTLNDYDPMNPRSIEKLWAPASVSVSETWLDLARVNLTVKLYAWTRKVELQYATVEQPIFSLADEISYPANGPLDDVLTHVISVPLTQNVTTFRFRVKYTGVKKWVGYSFHTEIDIIQGDQPSNPPTDPPKDPPASSTVSPLSDSAPLIQNEGPIRAPTKEQASSAGRLVAVLFVLNAWWIL